MVNLVERCLHFQADYGSAAAAGSVLGGAQLSKEEELRARIAVASRRRDEALRRRDAEASAEPSGARSVGATSTSFALAAAERDYHSRVSAVDALARWRSRE